MRFALIDNKRVEAEPKLKGICPGCLQTVISKCGVQRTNHWAHLNSRTCATWWEPETEWHRSWKNNFPSEWQEVILHDNQTGEKHIADVYTNNGMVIEFQHSHIEPQERITRENFYQDMVWVVDGMRVKRDYNRFIKHKSAFVLIKKGLFRVAYPEDCFSAAWLGSSKPVIFDFRTSESINSQGVIKGFLYCLFPVKIGNSAIVAELSRKAFIDYVINGELLSWVNRFMADLLQVKKEWQIQKTKQQQNALQGFGRAAQYRKSRRF